MNRRSRIQAVLSGLFMILVAVFIFIMGTEGFMFVILLLGITLVISGIRRLVYYCSMARYMNGGQSVLYLGVLIFDLGVLTLSVTRIPEFYLGIYLFLINAFSGGIDVMRAMESRRYGGRAWQFKLATGVISILLAIICIIFCREPFVTVVAYGVGLIISAIERIASAFRRTKLVYIE